jgi:uncharacterized membrane protein
MTTGRLEAFSDGVFAVIITLTVLNMKAPSEADWHALEPVLPVFASYVLSFIYLGIYWNNHHHLLHAAEHVTGGILWANLVLLFWLSMVPFTTAWIGQTNYAPVPVAVYGVMLLFAGISYFVLTKALINRHGKDSLLARSIGSDWKGAVSVLLYIVAIPLSFWKAAVACGIYVLVAILWLVPDPRIEKAIRD